VTLDPQAAEYLAAQERLGVRSHAESTVEEVRARIQVARASLGGSPEHVARVEEIVIDGPNGRIPTRAYLPSEAPVPFIVYLHGSGWVLGDLDMFDSTCRSLAIATGCGVLSVDYRLSPEHPFPQALEDGYAALSFAAAETEQLAALPHGLVICGSSSGGNLAAGVALMARDRGGPDLALQILVYPPLDYRFDTGSYLEFGEGNMRWYWDQYLASPSDGENPYASPLRSPDLAGVAPALVVVAEHDPLRDEGEEYARRLRSDGVITKLSSYGGMIHGFFSMGAAIGRATDLLAEIGVEIAYAVRLRSSAAPSKP
jgi:acetyl esterase